MRYTYVATHSRAHEAVEAMQTLLAAKVSLLQQLDGANVYAHEAPADKPASGKWVVVRERISIGGEPETASGLVFPTVQVMSESRRALHTAATARSFHAGVQDIIASVLLVSSLTVTTGEAKSVNQVERPSPVAYDADDDTRYSTSAFSVTMGPSA